MRDIHSITKAQAAISPVALGTTGTGQTSGVIDRQGYDSVEFTDGVGAITATNATVTPTILECATSNGSFTSVADTDLLGTEAGAAVLGAATRTNGVSKNITKQVGYRGGKRYLKLKLVNTVSAGIIGHADVLLANPMVGPVN